MFLLAMTYGPWQADTSVPADIAEGWPHETAKDKASLPAIAQGSLAETETLVSPCEELGWFADHETLRLRGLLDEARRMLTVMPPHLARFLP